MLEALQQGKELEHSGNGTIIGRDDYVNGLKKITLSYCQKHVLTMVDFWITFRITCATEKCQYLMAIV